MLIVACGLDPRVFADLRGASIVGCGWPSYGVRVSPLNLSFSPGIEIDTDAVAWTTRPVREEVANLPG
jgi:hypothetical protein